MRLVLYRTAGCHLCEDALAVLTRAGIAACTQQVEIGYDNALAERYGWRIPVLRLEADGRELDWPFSPEQVAMFTGGSGVPET